MSSSAGRVMPLPKGEYNALTEYHVLDIVSYQNGNLIGSYMAKGTTTGNLPTNTTYWQKLAEGQVVDPDDFMAVDGHNAENVMLIGSVVPDQYAVTSIAKDAGLNETVTIVITADSENAMYAEALKVLVGSSNVYYKVDDNKIYVIIDTVTAPSVDVSDVITLTAHLKEDDSAAIAISSTTLYTESYVDSTYDNAIVIGSGYAKGNGAIAGGTYSTAADEGLAFGYYCAAKGGNAFSVGTRNYSKGLRSFTEGMQNVAAGIDSHAAGNANRAGYDYQFVVGKYNDNTSGNLFEVGNGISAAARSNAFSVDANGYFRQDGSGERFKLAKVSGVLGFYTGNDVFHPYEEPPKVFTQSSVVLSTSQDTTVTFTDDSITADSMIDVYTNNSDIRPTSASVGGANNHTCTLTFAKVSSATTIGVRISVRNV